MLLDLRSFKVTGKDAQASLGRANITCNKNGIPFDTESPFITSGIRLGTPACTTRGFKEEEFKLESCLHIPLAGCWSLCAVPPTSTAP